MQTSNQTTQPQNDRRVCEKCNWRGLRSDLLRASNPFDAGKTICGCPACRRVNTMRQACIEEGCWERAVFFEYVQKAGWLKTCFTHKPSMKRKSKEVGESPVKKSRSITKL